MTDDLESEAAVREPTPVDGPKLGDSPSAREPAHGGAAARVRPLLPDAAEEGVCSVELDQFEGPLDLLLHLVRRHELDILDIPIAFVCEKYLAYIAVMRELDLEVAGDYLVMAATLAYLKSRELVPAEPDLETTDPEADDGPDPREALIGRLLQYQKFRAAAEQLDRLPVQGRDTFTRGQTVDLPPMDAGLAPITLFRLAEAYHRVLDRARILKNHEVVLETVSVAARMGQLTVVLIERGKVDFEALFLEREWSSEKELRGMLVVTLMSILELVRLGVARVHQAEAAGTLTIERAATEQEAREALAGYDEALSFSQRAGPSSSTEGEEPAPDASGRRVTDKQRQANDDKGHGDTGQVDDDADWSLDSELAFELAGEPTEDAEDDGMRRQDDRERTASDEEVASGADPGPADAGRPPQKAAAEPPPERAAGGWRQDGDSDVDGLDPERTLSPDDGDPEATLTALAGTDPERTLEPEAFHDGVHSVPPAAGRGGPADLGTDAASVSGPSPQPTAPAGPMAPEPSTLSVGSQGADGEGVAGPVAGSGEAPHAAGDRGDRDD